MKAFEVVTDLVGNIVDKIFPDKLNEAEKAEAKAKAERIVAETLLMKDGAFRNFVLDYEGKAADLSPTVQIIRSMVRPILTMMFSIVFSWMLLHPIDYKPEQIQVVFWIELIVLGFWFGDKATGNIIPAFAKFVEAKNSANSGK
ncbi:MAG: hypothetical protein KDB79_17060 [Acidobacteria bacterium]|nr:hypothetical protein [Acidobacteriota bacterium]